MEDLLDTQKSKSLSFYIENLSKMLFIFSGFSYLLGYVKYLIILKILNIDASVGDIYSVSSIFISGVSILISIFIVPLICFIFFPYLVNFIGKSILEKHKLKLTESGKLALVLLVCSVIYIFIITIKRMLINPYIITTNIVLLDLNSFVFTFDGLMILVFCIISVIESFDERKINFGITIKVLFIIFWSIMIFASFHKQVSDSIYNYNQFSIHNQDSGMQGVLYTKNKIPMYSHDSETDENVQATTGILLSINKDHYYFYAFYNFDDIKNGSLVIIPNDDIVLFYHSRIK